MADNNANNETNTNNTNQNTTTTKHPNQKPASPSPPPPAPVPLTPGPRASRLQQVFDQALARTLRANSYSNFSSCFPTPAKHVPASLESVWRQLNAKLEESARAEFEDIVAERDAVRQLNELDRLVGEARFRKDNDGDGHGEEGGEGEGEGGGQGSGSGSRNVAPHTLGAEQLYQAHLMPFLQEAQSSLNAKVDATQTQNETLSQDIQSQRMEIENLLSSLESVVGDLEGAAVAATQYGKGNDLRQNTMQMDGEVKARPEI